MNGPGLWGTCLRRPFEVCVGTNTGDDHPAVRLPLNFFRLLSLYSHRHILSDPCGERKCHFLLRLTPFPFSPLSQSPRHGRITAVSGKRATHETSRCRSAGAYCIEKDVSIIREDIHDKRSYFTTYHDLKGLQVAVDIIQYCTICAHPPFLFFAYHTLV